MPSRHHRQMALGSAPEPLTCYPVNATQSNVFTPPILTLNALSNTDAYMTVTQQHVWNGLAGCYTELVVTLAEPRCIISIDYASYGTGAGVWFTAALYVDNVHITNFSLNGSGNTARLQLNINAPTAGQVIKFVRVSGAAGSDNFRHQFTRFAVNYTSGA